MKTLLITLVLILASTAAAQKTFDLKNASKFFDIQIKVADCDQDTCKGEATFSFSKKGSSKPYQVIKLDETYVELEEGKPSVNVNLLYDKQSVVQVGDFNFDGMEDVALCNGNYGSYNGPSYDIYLSSTKARKFVYSKGFSDLGEHLGMFTVDKKKKTLETFDKSGCCLHYTTRYDVVVGKPRKIYEEIEDATIPDETKVKLTTKRLVAGKWKTSVRYVKR